MEAQHVDPADLPTPDEDQLLQQDAPLGPVPVRVEGNVYCVMLPSRSGPAFIHPLVHARPTNVVKPDPKRAAIHLCGTADWYYMRTGTSERLPMPMDVVVTLSHCDEIWAMPQSADTDASLSVIVEVYAD